MIKVGLTHQVPLKLKQKHPRAVSIVQTGNLYQNRAYVPKILVQNHPTNLVKLS